MIRQFLFSLLLLISFINVNGQQPNIDSLKHAINLTENDTLKLILFTRLTDAYTEIKPDSAYYYAKALSNLSQKLNLKLNEAYGLDQMSYALLNLGDYPRSLQTFLSAFAIADDPKNEKNILPEKYLNPTSLLKEHVSAHTQRIDVPGLACPYHMITSQKNMEAQSGWKPNKVNLLNSLSNCLFKMNRKIKLCFFNS